MDNIVLATRRRRRRGAGGGAPPVPQPNDLAYTPPTDIATLGGTFARASGATYYDAAGVVQYAAADELRNAHYLGAVRHTLLEPARTNHTKNVDQFGTTAATVVATGQAGAPDGSASAVRWTDTATNSSHGQFLVLPAIPDNSIVTLSVFLKPETMDYVAVRFQQKSSGVFRWAGWAIATGTPTAAMPDNALVTVRRRALANGWHRWSFSFNIGAGAQAPSLGLMMGNAPYNYPGTGQSFLVWGLQFEIAPWASSYIPTTTGAASRDADVLSFPDVVPGIDTTLHEDYYDLATAQDVTQDTAVTSSTPIVLAVGRAWRSYLMAAVLPDPQDPPVATSITLSSSGVILDEYNTQATITATVRDQYNNVMAGEVVAPLTFDPNIVDVQDLTIDRVGPGDCIVEFGAGAARAYLNVTSLGNWVRQLAKDLGDDNTGNVVPLQYIASDCQRNASDVVTGWNSRFHNSLPFAITGSPVYDPQREVIHFSSTQQMATALSPLLDLFPARTIVVVASAPPGTVTRPFAFLGNSGGTRYMGVRRALQSGSNDVSFEISTTPEQPSGVPNSGSLRVMILKKTGAATPTAKLHIPDLDELSVVATNAFVSENFNLRINSTLAGGECDVAAIFWLNKETSLAEDELITQACENNIPGVVRYMPSVATPTSIELLPAAFNVAPGGTQQLSWVVRDAGGNPLGGFSVQFSTSASGVATVNAQGVVQGVAAGNATITATVVGYPGVTDTSAATVSATRVATSVVISPTSGSVVVGGTADFGITVRDQFDQQMTSGYVLAASASNGNASTAIITNNTIRVTGVSAGAVTINVIVDGGTLGTIPVQVATAGAVASVKLLPRDLWLVPGETVQATPKAYDSTGVVVGGQTWDQWTSSHPTIASVNASGQVSYVAAGTPDTANYPVTITCRNVGTGLIATMSVYTDATAYPNKPASYVNARSTTAFPRKFHSVASMQGDNVGSELWDSIESRYLARLLTVGGTNPAGTPTPQGDPLDAPTRRGGLASYGQSQYPKDWAAGSSPILVQRDVSVQGKKYCYFHAFYRVDPNFKGNISSTNKCFFVDFTNTGLTAYGANFFISAEGRDFNPMHWEARLQGGEAFQVAHYPPNLIGPSHPLYNIIKGRFYRLEGKLYSGTPGAADGTIEMWTNGVKTHDYIGVNFKKAGHLGTVGQLKWQNIWGGGGEIAPYLMWHDADELYLAVGDTP